MTTLVLTDNVFARRLADELCDRFGDVVVRQSPSGALPDVKRVDVQRDVDAVVEAFDLVISVHCKQIFPPELVRRVRCVNVHPGWNPYNRGWFPQVFSILNGFKSGVTIHEIDDELDHGPIIAQREYTLKPWDTSGTAYAELMKIEREMLLEKFAVIRSGDYVATPPAEDGNVNYKRDFHALCSLDLDSQGSLREFLKLLRATSHAGYRNAYFRDADGRRVYVRIELELDPG